MVSATASLLPLMPTRPRSDRKSTRLNSSHGYISYAVFCLKKKKKQDPPPHRLYTTAHLMVFPLLHIPHANSACNYSLALASSSTPFSAQPRHPLARAHMT